MNYNDVDLHTHTSASDGMHTPSENVRMAKQSGLIGIAITDHDTVAGLEEAVYEGEQTGLVVVPGIEISTVAKGQDIHILGYYMDFKNVHFLKQLEQLRETRNRRNEIMIEKLQRLGLNITMEEVLSNIQNMKEDDTVGRPHIADIMIHKGYVSTMKEAFDKYLGKHGTAYANPERITPLTAVEWIHNAGGRAVIAHPGLYHDDSIVYELIEGGVDGIEVYHSDHSSEVEAHYLQIANKHELIVTAGSDFHGERAGEVFHGPIGNRKINADVLSLLKGRS